MSYERTVDEPIHIFAAAKQPATRFKDASMPGRPHIFQYPKRRTFPCSRCRKRRWAANLQVQVYYDGIYFWCRPGKGCKIGRTR